MYDYIKKNFPGSIIIPEIKENEYRWRFCMGGVSFAAIDICSIGPWKTRRSLSKMY
jgi:hypothetical protein